jgi:biopolymer transport protein ExbD
MRLQPSAHHASEPNLTPLLDMVLQLIMFFMICVSFVGHESDFDIRLPVMQHACPPEPSDGRLILNVDRAGILHVSNHGPLESDSAILSLLNGWAKTEEHPDKRATRLVVIRADARADYRMVHHVMTLCKKAGFSRFQLRTAAAS